MATCHGRGRCQAWKGQDAFQTMELFWTSGWSCWLSCIQKGKGKWWWAFERNQGPIALLQQQLNPLEAQKVTPILKSGVAGCCQDYEKQLADLKRQQAPSLMLNCTCICGGFPRFYMAEATAMILLYTFSNLGHRTQSLGWSRHSTSDLVAKNQSIKSMHIPLSF